MQTITLNWTEASFGEEPSSEAGTFTLIVPLSQRIGGFYLRALKHQVSNADGQVWGGRWGGIRVFDSSVEVRGVGHGSEEPLRAHLDRLVEQAHDAARELEARDRDIRKANADAAEERRRKAEEMTAAIREP